MAKEEHIILKWTVEVYFNADEREEDDEHA